MKKFTLIFLGLLIGMPMMYAGGLIHNTNQSAAWSRILVRDATTEIDAVYFNPAGLTKLADGFHISLSSQSIFQTQTITNTFPYLNESEYIGKITAPVFPSVYLAYKTGNWAFSLGVNAIGGGGGAKFDKGVPMMEMGLAAMVPMMQGMFPDDGITGYSADMMFEGKSAYWGIQGGISYAINDNFSIYAGARYVMAKTTYEGYLKDITLTTAGGDTRADAYLGGKSQDFSEQSVAATEAATLAQGAGDLMQPLIDAGAGGYTIAEATAGGILTPEQAAQMVGGLMQFGYTAEEIGLMNIGEAQGAFYYQNAYYSAASEQLTAAAMQFGAMAMLMGDQVGDITQEGTGITPIVGMNLSFLDDDINIGFKYEFRTKMDITQTVPEGKGFAIGLEENGETIYMFVDGQVTKEDIPAMLSIGFDWKVAEAWKLSLGYHSYLDKSTRQENENRANHATTIDNNFWEFGLGLEYDINEKFLVSLGYLRAETGVNEFYQSNLGFSLTTNTIGGGAAWKINDMFKLNLGGYYVMYDQQDYNLNYRVGDTPVPYTESYLKSTFAGAIGVDITIGSKK